LKVQRSEQYDGVVFEVVVNLQFIKEAIPYIKNAFITKGGIDALVQVTIMEYDPNQYLWEVYQRGKINFNDYTFDNTTLSVTVEQVSDQSLVTNALGTDNAIYYTETVALHSKKLLRQYESASDVEAPTELLNLTTLGKYYALFQEIVSKDEVEILSSYPNQLNLGDPMAEGKAKFVVTEAGDYTITITGRTTYRIDGVGANWTAGDDFRYLLVYGKPGGYTTITLDTFAFVAGGDDVEISFTDTQTITLTAGDEIF